MTSESAGFSYQVTLTRSVIVRLVAYSVLLLWAAFDIFAVTTEWTVPMLNAATISASVLVYGMVLALHEWVHGAAMRVFGARPEYGIMIVRGVLPVAYATAPRHRFTVRQMVIIGLAPMVTLSAAALAVATLVPSLGYYAWVAFAGNFTGAVGDLWMVAVIWRFNRCQEAHVIDQKSGLTIESTDPDAPLIAANLDRGGRRLTRLAVGSFVILIAILWCGPPMAHAFAPPDASRFLIGPSWFPLIEWTRADDQIWLYYRNVLVASILLALPALLLPLPRRRSDADNPQSGPDMPGVPALI